MGQDTYSTYEAKARLSELLRKVRHGRVVTITYHGEPIAEVRPIPRTGTALEDHLVSLEEQGILVRAKPTADTFKGLVKRPGALGRFLEDRE